MKKEISQIIIPFLILLIGTPLEAQKAGEYYYIQSAIANKYLDVQWGKDNDGTPLHLWPYNGNVAQQFKLEDAGEGYFYIKSVLDKYIHVQNRSDKPKALALLWSGKGNDNNKWSFVPASDGYYYIRSKKGTYLDVAWAKPENGTPIWLWTFNGKNNQRWKFKKIPKRNIIKPEPSFEDLKSVDIELYKEIVSLKTIYNLCPSALVGGDFEFGGNGPKVFGSITLVKGDDNKQIFAQINFNAQETKKDFLTGRSEVKGYWKISVYRAPYGKYINGIVPFNNTTTKFNKVLQGGGANELFGGGGDGSPHILQINNGLDGKGLVSHFEVVGDTGGWDISRDADCTNDTRILKIIFKPLEIELVQAKQ